MVNGIQRFENSRAIINKLYFTFKKKLRTTDIVINDIELLPIADIDERHGFRMPRR